MDSLWLIGLLALLGFIVCVALAYSYFHEQPIPSRKEVEAEIIKEVQQQSPTNNTYLRRRQRDRKKKRGRSSAGTGDQ
jgi:hypothetical protein